MFSQIGGVEVKLLKMILKYSIQMIFRKAKFDRLSKKHTIINSHIKELGSIATDGLSVRGCNLVSLA